MIFQPCVFVMYIQLITLYGLVQINPTLSSMAFWSCIDIFILLFSCLQKVTLK